MEKFLQIANNPWVTGIVGGIISGLVVYLVTTWFFSKKQNKEYYQKVRTANNELLYAVRPLLAQKQIPTKAILQSAIESMARKYEVNVDDLTSVAFLSNDLIREVMENAFLDSDQKIDFCNRIHELKEEVGDTNLGDEDFARIVYSKDRVSFQYVSILLAATASVMVLFVSSFPRILGTINFESSRILLQTSTITGLVVLIPIIMMTLMLFFRKIRDKKPEEAQYIEKEIYRQSDLDKE